MAKKSGKNEYRIYPYIDKVLSELGWDTNNPSGRKGGGVYSQGEFRDHNELLTKALGLKTPENIILIDFEDAMHFWIVEAKADHKDLEKALKQAKGYADKINEAHPDKDLARFATGIAGTDEDSHLVSTLYWTGREWKEVSINDHETTGFLTSEQCEDILVANSPNIDRFDDDPDRFKKRADAINETLHKNDIAVGDRAKILGALLLAIAEDSAMRTKLSPKQLIREVNANIDQILEKHGKEDFAGFIKLAMPGSEKNHKAFKKAIVETLQILREMNVRSMINSGEDTLGKFYETFLKYANGAKEMGIVLTPRHITKFAVDVLGITWRDVIYDPTCGTGGFLVSAMDEVRQAAKSKQCTDKEFKKFLKHGLWGVEKEDPVYSLALVNMIFRGDGKSGLNDGDCFDHQFWTREGNIWETFSTDRKPEAKKPFSRVLMNPPFKKEGLPETKFVDHALEQCKDNALLFAVLPYVNIEGDEFSQWRQETLKRHTVKAVIQFDKNLFYPVQEGTYGLILQAHTPHIQKDKVFMGVLFDDNSRARPSKMLSVHSKKDNVEEMTERLQYFLRGKALPGKSNIPNELILTTINPDEGCSFAPQKYIQSAPAITVPNITDKGLNLLVAMHKAGNQKQPNLSSVPKMKKFPLMNFMKDTVKPPLKKALKHYQEGRIPAVTATADSNGVDRYLDVPQSEIVSHLMSISKTHNTKPGYAFWHPYDFTAINTVHLVRPQAEFASSTEIMLYLCQEISDRNSWRYDYARTVKLSELEVYLPVKDDESIDLELMTKEGKKQLQGIL